MPERQTARGALLQHAGWGDATAAFLAGDASDRTYQRLVRRGETAVLMDAPPGKGDDPATFLAVARHLCSIGLSAPQLIAADLDAGFLLLEDFGDALFARFLDAEPAKESALYAVATDALLLLQAHPPIPDLPALSPADWATAAAFAIDHYRAAISDTPADKVGFIACLTDLIAAQQPDASVMILRDFHAENLIWLPQRKGAARAGLLDFQLAQLGHPVYDVISLLQDARRDVHPETASNVRRQFCTAKGMSKQGFDAAAAVWGAQRALRILGVFTRLARLSGKTSYVSLIPRVWGHLQVSLQHPTLLPLQLMCASLLPPPTHSVLAAIRQTSGG